MRKLNLDKLTKLPAAGIDTAIRDMRDVADEITKEIEFGVDAIVNKTTGKIIDYTDLGDKENYEVENVNYKMFGQDNIVPIVRSKYAQYRGKESTNRDVFEWKTFGFDTSLSSSKMIAETAENVYRLAYFYSRYIEIPFRGLIPEMRAFGENLSTTPGEIPLFGKAFLDAMIGNPSSELIQNSPDMRDRLEIKSASLQFKEALFREFLKVKIGIWNWTSDILNGVDSKANDWSDVVSPVPYVADRLERAGEEVLIDAAVVNKVQRGNRLDKTIEPKFMRYDKGSRK